MAKFPLHRKSIDKIAFADRRTEGPNRSDILTRNRTSSLAKLVHTIVMIGIPIIFAYAQTPKPGKYESVDGRFAISISVKSDGAIEVTEPTKVSVYRKDGNYYRHSEQKYSSYLIRVGNGNEIYTSKEGNGTEYRFNWVSSDDVSSGGCTLYEKYLKKSEDADGNEVQAWAFCAAAAQAKCTYTADGFKAVVKGVVASLKPIMLNKGCPCEDVIPKEIWDAQ